MRVYIRATKSQRLTSISLSAEMKNCVTAMVFLVVFGRGRALPKIETGDGKAAAVHKGEQLPGADQLALETLGNGTLQERPARFGFPTYTSDVQVSKKNFATNPERSVSRRLLSGVLADRSGRSRSLRAGQAGHRRPPAGDHRRTGGVLHPPEAPPRSCALRPVQEE